MCVRKRSLRTHAASEGTQDNCVTATQYGLALCG